jgi:hypothetical protein
MIAGAIVSVVFDGAKKESSAGEGLMGCVALLVVIPSGLAAAVMGVIGIILFVKWVWNS